MRNILLGVAVSFSAVILAIAPAGGSPSNSTAAARAHAMHTRMENHR